jgi:hypothetical protein
MTEELTVGFNPLPAAERVAYYNGQVRSRLLWLGMAIVICLALWLWQAGQLNLGQSLALFGAGIGYSLIWLLIAVIGLITARTVLNRIGQGLAMNIGRWGIGVLDSSASWSQITEITTTRGGIGTGPALVVKTTQGDLKRIPLMHLDAMPGTIDAAVRAYSGGSRWLDTSRLAN